jgi:hypothetical protein
MLMSAPHHHWRREPSSPYMPCSASTRILCGRAFTYACLLGPTCTLGHRFVSQLCALPDACFPGLAWLTPLPGVHSGTAAALPRRLAATLLDFNLRPVRPGSSRHVGSASGWLHPSPGGWDAGGHLPWGRGSVTSRSLPGKDPSAPCPGCLAGWRQAPTPGSGPPLSRGCRLTFEDRACAPGLYCGVST